MYKQYTDGIGNVVNGVIRTLDNVCIPFDLANTDYQAYLKFLDDGGIPEPAEVTNEQP